MGSPAPLRLLAPCCSPTHGCARWCTGTTHGTPGLCAALFLSVFSLFDTSTSSTLPSRETPVVTVGHHLHDVVSLFLPATDKETFAADILTSLTTFSFFLPSTSARGPIKDCL